MKPECRAFLIAALPQKDFIMVKIVVLQRGWVVVGEFKETDKEVTVSKASVVRRWGTSRGLGELVSGPTSSTVLDPVGTIRAHPLALVMTIDVDEKKWVAALK
jgi:hypothetical protein